MRYKLIFTLFLFTMNSAYADEALQEVQKTLLDRKARESITSTDPKAKSADDFVTQVTGGNQQHKDEIYAVSSEIMGHIVNTYGSDPEKLQAEMSKAMKDPKAFMEGLPPSMKEKIKNISQKIEAKQGSVKPKP